MFQNYLKIAFRSLLKKKVYTAINMVGLAVSVGACLLITLYVRHEFSYDKFFSNGDRIYKMAVERKYPTHATFYSIVPHSYAQSIQRDFPEVENVLQLFGPIKNSVVTYKVSDTEVKSFEEDYVIQTDSSFFKFFDIDLVKGDKSTALALPNQILVSESTAKKYFGSDDPIGKLLGGDVGDVKVTGVFKDLPDNSHLRFDFLTSLAGEQFRQLMNQQVYTRFDSHTYIKLKPGSSFKSLEDKFPRMVDTYASSEIERDLGKSWTAYKKAGNGYRYFLQPLTSIHLDSRSIEYTITPSGNIQYVFILLFVASLILVIACVNFMNLATARSTERAREVGMRKVMGSMKTQLVFQFLIEAILLTLSATAIAVLGAQLLLSSFNSLVSKNLHLVIDSTLLGGLTVVVLFVGILAGLYPAFVLSSYNPVVVMKGNFHNNAKGVWLKNGLVVFQFMISMVLIVGTVVVENQMSFIQKKDLGYDREQVLMIGRAFVLDRHTETFIEEVRSLPEAKEIAGTGARVGNSEDLFGERFSPEGSDEILSVKSMFMDDDFAKTVGFELKEGRFFSKLTNDSLSIILNETAVRTWGLADPIGRKLKSDGVAGTQQQREQTGRRIYTVIGIVKDFNFQSLRDEITPLAIHSYEVFNQYPVVNFVAVKLKEGQFQQALPKIQNKWKELAPGQPLQYEFLDQNLELNYVEEQRSGKVFAVFSILAIVISCVGLYGLSAYTASLRIKEIGIRKVMGASVMGILIMLSKDFTKLVLIAFTLAVPIAWWLMSIWLSGFAFRISLGVGAFVLAGAIALTIAWLTVSYQSIKASMSNPVKSLKGE